MDAIDSCSDVLTYHRNALISEIQGLKEDHEVEVNGMTITHHMELHALQEKTKAVIKEGMSTSTLKTC